MTDTNDLPIIRAVLGGDTNAFASLVHKYKDVSMNLAYQIVLNREDAEEVAQDSFVKAFTKLSTFKAESKFTTWLYCIVVNTALNKKKVSKNSPLQAYDYEQHDIAEASFADLAIRAEHRFYIQLALKDLHQNERICLTLFYLEEQSVEEITVVTGLTRANIKVLLHRGRKNLYQALERHLKSELKNLI